MKVKEIIRDNSIWMPNEKYNSVNPNVSVLLPTFSRAKSGYFKKAVESVLNQSYKNIELIIVDDCSVDGTFDIIKEMMMQDSRINCIRHKSNIGLPAISEYEAYIKARGEYIAFIFDDNEWCENAIEDTIALMQEKNLKATYGISRLIYGHGENEYIELGNILDINIDNILCDNFIANGSVVLHREVIEKVGLYDPHLALTRLCDWDLWRRISRHYELVPTGILFTYENGYILSDSLGNSYKMDIWAAEEQMRIYRDESLTPQNYGEYNIIDFNNGRSQFFTDCIEKYLMQYNQKKWYIDEKGRVDNILISKNINHKCKRIVIITDAITASTILYFNRIFMGAEHVIKFCLTQNIYTGYLALADAVVIERNLVSNNQYVKLVKELGIPCYYFVDDNFIELYKENKDNSDLRSLAEYTVAENLKEFNGIILSCKNMVEYFNKNSLHDNLILLEPCIDEYNLKENYNSFNSESISVAFMGGAFRDNILISCVLPALQEISKKRTVYFYCPKDKKTEINEFKSDTLKIYEIPRSLSLDTTINRYKEKNINIQIHCGERIRNNKYKTKNALINAVQLGALLITSYVEPFITNDANEGSYLLAKNTVEDWYDKIEALIQNESLRKDIYQNAYNLCKNTYTGKLTEKHWANELNQIKETTYYEINKKYEALYLALYKENSRLSSATTYIPTSTITKMKKPIDSSRLRFTGHIKEAKKYNFICDVPYMSEIGIIFAGCGTCNGNIKIKLSCKGYVLRESQVSMENITYNDWTYFLFDSLYGCGGKKMTLTIEFEYDKDSEQMGLFEDTVYRTFIYKVFNKLKKPMKGLNVVYVDCRR